MSTLANKRALVLGGSRGIGAAIVRRLAADGADVTFTYSGSAEAAQTIAKETGAKAVQSDSASRDATTSTVREAGPLDILVVNAGVAMIGDPTEMDPDQVDRMIDINIRSPYHASVEASKTMRDGGRIVLIGSVNGDRVPFAGAAAYGMTKSALQSMARGLAHDFGPRAITVNVVQPGPIDTDMNPADGPMSEMIKPMLALKRYGTATEIAGMVAYLVGPEAGYVTGAMHTIDGGMGA